MRTLSTFSDTPFDDRQISLDELAAFSTDNLERMTANNPGGALNARIAATSTALAGFDDAFTGDLTKLGLRKARKLAKDNFRADLPREAGKIVIAVINQYGENSPEVLEVVPQGRSAFSNARDDALENHLSTLVAGVTAHEDDLGAPLVAQATALHDEWLALYAASEAATGQKTATEEEKRNARGILQWELYLNLMEIVKLFPRQPEKISLYMQQSLLGFPVSGGSGGGPGGGGLPSSEPSSEGEESSAPSSEESGSSSEPPASSTSSELSSSSSSELSSSSSSEPVPPSSSSSEPSSSSSSEPPSSSSSSSSSSGV